MSLVNPIWACSCDVEQIQPPQVVEAGVTDWQKITETDRRSHWLHVNHRERGWADLAGLNVCLSLALYPLCDVKETQMSSLAIKSECGERTSCSGISSASHPRMGLASTAAWWCFCCGAAAFCGSHCLSEAVWSFWASPLLRNKSLSLYQWSCVYSASWEPTMCYILPAGDRFHGNAGLFSWLKAEASEITCTAALEPRWQDRC